MDEVVVSATGTAGPRTGFRPGGIVLTAPSTPHHCSSLSPLPLSRFLSLNESISPCRRRGTRGWSLHRTVDGTDGRWSSARIRRHRLWLRRCESRSGQAGRIPVRGEEVILIVVASTSTQKLCSGRP